MTTDSSRQKFTWRTRLLAPSVLIAALLALPAGIGEAGSTNRSADVARANPVLEIAPATLGPGNVAPRCTGSTSIVADPDTVVTGERLDAYNDGYIIHLYHNYGHALGEVVDVPVCAVQDVGGTPVAAWSYCTERERSVCNTHAAWSVVADVPSLTPLQNAQIAAVLAGADESTSDSRQEVQMQIWCISENYPVGSFTHPTYGAMNCDPRPTVSETVPSLAVTGPTVVAPDEVAEFTIETNIQGDIALGVTEGTLSICPGDGSGAVLSGSTLTTGTLGSHSVTVCVTGPFAAPSVTLSASATAAFPSSIRLHHNNLSGCQVFLSGVSTSQSLDDSATVDVQDETPTTTTEPEPTTTTEPEPTTTTEPEPTTTTEPEPTTTTEPEPTTTTEPEPPTTTEPEPTTTTTEPEPTTTTTDPEPTTTTTQPEVTTTTQPGGTTTDPQVTTTEPGDTTEPGGTTEPGSPSTTVKPAGPRPAAPSGGKLPSTGSDTAVPAMIAAAVLGAGLALLAISRLRTTRHEV